MRISALSESFQPEFRKLDAARRAEKPAKAKPVDRSEISSKAHQLSDTRSQVEVIATQIANQPDIRPEKIAEVQEKIRNGFYNSPEFIDTLANKLLQEFGIRNA
jgi:anti-sigma28 factor (negative regulator of flagellin synthesis)